MLVNGVQTKQNFIKNCSYLPLSPVIISSIKEKRSSILKDNIDSLFNRTLKIDVKSYDCFHSTGLLISKDDAFEKQRTYQLAHHQKQIKSLEEEKQYNVGGYTEDKFVAGKTLAQSTPIIVSYASTGKTLWAKLIELDTCKSVVNLATTPDFKQLVSTFDTYTTYVLVQNYLTGNVTSIFKIGMSSWGYTPFGGITVNKQNEFWVGAREPNGYRFKIAIFRFQTFGTQTSFTMKNSLRLQDFDDQINCLKFTTDMDYVIFTGYAQENSAYFYPVIISYEISRRRISDIFVQGQMWSMFTYYYVFDQLSILENQDDFEIGTIGYKYTGTYSYFSMNLASDYKGLGIFVATPQITFVYALDLLTQIQYVIKIEFPKLGISNVKITNQKIQNFSPNNVYYQAIQKSDDLQPTSFDQLNWLVVGVGFQYLVNTSNILTYDSAFLLSSKNSKLCGMTYTYTLGEAITLQKLQTSNKITFQFQELKTELTIFDASQSIVLSDLNVSQSQFCPKYTNILSYPNSTITTCQVSKGNQSLYVVKNFVIQGTCSDASIGYSFSSNSTQNYNPSLFTFTKSSMIINCNPTLSSQVGTYNLSLVGTLSYPQAYGQVNPISRTIFFQVNVVDESCNTATLMVITPKIYNMTYIYGYPEMKQLYSFQVSGGDKCQIDYKLVDNLGNQNTVPIVFDNTSIIIQLNNGNQDKVMQYTIIASVQTAVLSYASNSFFISFVSQQSACLSVPISQQTIVNNFSYSLNQGKVNLTNITYYQGDGQNYSFNVLANNQNFNLYIANGGLPVTFEIQIMVYIEDSTTQMSCTPVFSVTIDDMLCYIAVLTPKSFNEQVSEYTILDSALILTFDYWNDESFQCGSYEYSISYSNTFISDIFVSANLTTRSVRIYGTNLNILTQDLTITLKGSIFNGRYAQVQKSIKIINPCQDLKLNLISNCETTYYIKDNAYDYYLPQSTLNLIPEENCPKNIEYQVKRSGFKILSHEAFYTIPIPNTCTDLTVAAFVDDRVILPKFIQYQPKFSQISINSQDIKDVGEYIVTIGGYASGYNINSTFSLKMLNPCKDAIIKPTSIKDVLYLIGSGEMQVKFPSWKSTIKECNGFTYEAMNEEKSLPVPDVINLDANSRTFIIKVDNSNLDGKNYLIKVIGRTFYGFQRTEFVLTLTSTLNQASTIAVYGGKIIDLSKIKKDLTASIKQISMDGQVQVKFSKNMLNFNDTTAIKVLAAMAGVASSSITGSVTINLILSIVLGVSMKNLWMLMNTLQILVMIPLLWLSLPANLTIMCKALIDIANLNFIPKDTINEYVRKFLFKTKGYLNFQIAANIGLLNANDDDILNTLVATFMFLSLFMIPFIILFLMRKHFALLTFQYYYMPFDTKNQQFFEIYNETTILLVSYCLLPYSQDYFTEDILDLRTNLGWVIVGIIGINILLNQLNLIVQAILMIYQIVKRKLQQRKLKKLKEQQERKYALQDQKNQEDFKNLSQNTSLDLHSSFDNKTIDDEPKVLNSTFVKQKTKKKSLDLSKGRKTLKMIKDLIIPKPAKKAKKKFSSNKSQEAIVKNIQTVQEDQFIDKIHQGPNLVLENIKILEQSNKPKKSQFGTAKTGGNYSNMEELEDDFDNTKQDLLYVDFLNNAKQDISFQQKKSKSQQNLLEPIKYLQPEDIAKNKILKVGKRDILLKQFQHK
ncbi:UNKNOWN [Stylonychia lemnae]|uniref:Cadg domain containing protein n=1 Tax=Stylonychia lemnae TaxID=5949 RepID=A0A078AMF7_STYLE|nr:UNKNOWN [Stylonychia lemnae]|eukprot:CDW83359.1 UNKNOWN [Stylonychia lemnae]